MARSVLAAALAAALASAACDDGGNPPPAVDRAALLDPQNCQSCHPAHHAQWAASMHAYASDDPVFLAMNRRGQRETNGALGDFCVKCHAPTAVREGLTTNGLNLETLPRAMKGVTCTFCHTVESVNGAHNNPLTLTSDGVMLGPIADPAANSFHRSRYSPYLDSGRAEGSNACGACHDIVNGKGTPIERTFAEWKATLFGQPVTGQGCGACHMSGSDGLAASTGKIQRRVHDHAFPALDVALTPFPGADAAAQAQAVRAELGKTLQPALCYDPRFNRAVAVLDNAGAGHSWPSGAASDRRAWLEVVAYKQDQVIYQSGVPAMNGALDPAADPDLLLMRDCFFDEAGRDVHMFWEAAKVSSNLVPGPQPLSPGGQPPPAHLRWDLPPASSGRELPAKPDRMTMRVRVQPVASEVLHALVDGGDLDPSYLAALPTYDLPNTDLEWLPSKVKIERTRDGDLLCVSAPGLLPGYVMNSSMAFSQAICDPARQP